MNKVAHVFFEIGRWLCVGVLGWICAMGIAKAQIAPIRVVNQLGTPLSTGRVILRNNPLNLEIAATSQPDGWFSWGAVPDGLDSIGVFHDGYEPQWVSSQALPRDTREVILFPKKTMNFPHKGRRVPYFSTKNQIGVVFHPDEGPDYSELDRLLEEYGWETAPEVNHRPLDDTPFTLHPNAFLLRPMEKHPPLSATELRIILKYLPTVKWAGPVFWGGNECPCLWADHFSLRPKVGAAWDAKSREAVSAALVNRGFSKRFPTGEAGFEVMIPLESELNSWEWAEQTQELFPDYALEADFEMMPCWVEQTCLFQVEDLDHQPLQGLSGEIASDHLDIFNRPKWIRKEKRFQLKYYDDPSSTFTLYKSGYASIRIPVSELKNLPNATITLGRRGSIYLDHYPYVPHAEVLAVTLDTATANNPTFRKKVMVRLLDASYVPEAMPRKRGGETEVLWKFRLEKQAKHQQAVLAELDTIPGIRSLGILLNEQAATSGVLSFQAKKGVGAGQIEACFQNNGFSYAELKPRIYEVKLPANRKMEAIELWREFQGSVLFDWVQLGVWDPSRRQN